VTAERDIEYIISRFRKEGYSFLGVTLANFGKDVERLLAGNLQGDKLFLGFKSRKGQCLPAFLSGFTSRIFAKDGTVLADADPLAIYAVRQITLAWAKCEFPMAQTMVNRGITKYLQTEEEVRSWDSTFSEEELSFQNLKQVFLALFWDSLNQVEHRLFNLAVIPRHGPGYTASHAIGNSKWYDLHWTQRLDRVLPYQEFIRASGRHDFLVDAPNLLSPWNEDPVRVTFVPKTVDKCRTIAMEPTSMMYAQKAVANALRESFEIRTPYGCVKNFLDLNDQDHNRNLARKGSLDGSLATLDLSDASDRVSNQLVRALLDGFPLLFEAVDATRSRKADIQGKVYRLSKYASMGSDMCFPIESMIFLAIAVMSCLEKKRLPGYSHLPTNPKNIRELVGSVSVYGDDIIVPSDTALIAIRNLETFGFKVNDRKSFWTGLFRESCGADWYNGTDISVSRLRRPIPIASSQAKEIVSLVEFRNDLFQKRGLWKTAEYLDGIIESKIRWYPPVHHDSSSVLGAHTFLDPDFGPEVYWDTQLHKYAIKGYFVKDRLPVNIVDGWEALLKFFVEREDLPLNHEALLRSGRPAEVYLNIGWGSPK
jgi:hypothetical protein